MEVSCPQCGRELGADDVNISAAVGRCEDCDTVFNLTDESARERMRSNDWATDSPEESSGEARQEVPTPEGVEMDDDGRELELRWSWFRWYHLFSVLFVVFWDGFLCVWYGVAFGAEDAGLAMKLFPLIHVAVGIGLTYYTVACLFNSTTIRVDRDRIDVSHGPIPWWNQKSVSSRDVDQLFCKRQVRRGRNGRKVSYDVRFIDDTGREGTLVPRLSSENRALYVEQEIEAYLGIVDRDVPGEVGTEGSERAW